jgi:hypothetical protein
MLVAMKRAVVRLPPEIVNRLDQLATRFRAAHPGRSCSRAAVVRALIAGELAVVEQGGDRLDELERRAIRPRTERRRGSAPLREPVASAVAGGA